jgi:archaemetzincin
MLTFDYKKAIATIIFVLFLGTVVFIHHHVQSARQNAKTKDTSEPPLTPHSPPQQTLREYSPLLHSDTTGDFASIPEPMSGDWLANFEEAGQTLEEFLKSKRNKPDSKRRILYLQPMWEFDTIRSPSLDMLVEYTATYFGMRVICLPTIAPSLNKFRPRRNNRQVHAGKILDYLLKQVPDSAFCILGVTMMDLYPDPGWNFVFGYASYTQRVGVFSFARYDPAFYGEKCTTMDDKKLILLRSCKTLSHEIGHMFGLAHCIDFHCNMNGSNNLNESDLQPIHLCSVCLQKLQHPTSFNSRKRYRQLVSFYGKAGFHPEAQWVHNRLKKNK